MSGGVPRLPSASRTSRRRSKDRIEGAMTCSSTSAQARSIAT
jgi:hypothetical protein